MKSANGEDLGDMNLASTRFRYNAINIIKKKGRPMASIEVRESLRKCEPDLCEIVEKKCGDYARIILSHSEKFGIVKYKPRVPFVGIDRRTVFYGHIDANYNPADWIPVGEWHKHKNNHGQRKNTKRGKKIDSKSITSKNIPIAIDSDDCGSPISPPVLQPIIMPSTAHVSLPLSQSTKSLQLHPIHTEKVLLPPIPQTSIFPRTLGDIMNDFIGL